MEINPAGNWSFWSEDMKAALEQSRDNTAIGDKMVYENDAFKVWTIHLPAGKSLLFHKHCKPYFYIALTPGKSRSFYNDGSVKEIEYKVNDIKNFNELTKDNSFIHNLENIGETTLIFTTVEFKTNKK